MQQAVVVTLPALQSLTKARASSRVQLAAAVLTDGLPLGEQLSHALLCYHFVICTHM